MWSDDYEGNGNAGGNSDGYEGGWEGTSAAYEAPARKWVGDELRAMAEAFPFAVCVYFPETGRELVRRNLSLADAEAIADREAAEGRTVHVSLDTCG